MACMLDGCLAKGPHGHVTGTGATARPNPGATGECICWTGNPQDFGGELRDCPIHGAPPDDGAENGDASLSLAGSPDDRAGGVVNHIVALSGGKDSTAMALRLAEVEPREYPEKPGLTFASELGELREKFGGKIEQNVIREPEPEKTS